MSSRATQSAPPTSVFAPGKTALITGGASGIGLAVAQLCARHGMKVALVDVDRENLATAASSVAAEHSSNGSDQKADVETFTLDVSQKEGWNELKVQVGKRFGSVDLLMLNAGIGLNSGWEDVEYFHKIMDVNLFGVINGISTFLPSVKAGTSKDKPSAIVITGSKQGITNPPGNVAYNASKAAIKSLAESLAFELRDSSTSVHLLVPGWTFTGITGNGRNSLKKKPAGAWEAKQVADFLEKKMADGKFYIVCPDNDVTEDLDKRRMLWAAGDIVEERPPLSRWREDWKDRAKDGIEKLKLGTQNP